MKKILFYSFLLLASNAFAQSVLSPNDFLKHNIGEQFTPHHQLVDYYEHVAENSPNVMLKYYGDTYEGRPLILAFVSTPENLAKLEDIRLNQLRRTGLEEGEVDNDLDLAITWLSYTVHGNEAAGSEASMSVLYELVAPGNERTKEWLENSVVILDPCLNPDGYSRYTHWYRRYGNRIPNPDLNSLEHNEAWPNGRVNHYLFDLNRDWAWVTQIESQQRLKVYNQWMPHVHADLHEMGINSPYYFAPAAQPYHKYITDWQADFQMDIGENHAKYFDEEGWLYYTREIFDLLYPSYGDTYPVFSGAIGMTYEQGGSGRAGIVGESSYGDMVTLKDRTEHHKVTSLSTIEIAAKNASRLNQNFNQYFKDARNNPAGEYKTYIIKASNPKAKLEQLTNLLDLHKIEYGTLSQDAKVSGFHYKTTESKNGTISKGDLVISAYQPKGVLTQVLFDPETAVVDSLTYDITAWALPFAHGLDAIATKQKITPNAAFELPKATASKKVENAYAYAIRWQSTQDAHFLAQLLKTDLKVRYATQGFKIDGQSFDAGTLVLTQADNRMMGEEFSSAVEALAKELNQEVMALSTGFSEAGKDLGSGSYQFIQKPKVAIVGDRPTFTNEFGQVWYYFERTLNYPVTVLTMSNLFRVDLDDYNVLVLPEGRFRFNESQAEQLSDWVRGGGRLIAIGNSVRAFPSMAGFSLETGSNGESSDSKDAAPAVYGNSTREYISSTTPGAIFETKIDETHPLGFGLGDTYYSLKTGTQAYPYQDNIWNVGYLNDDPKTFGFVGSEARKQLKKNMIFGVEESGRGQVIYLVDNPLYRGFWEQGKLLFSNALFLVQ
ncbi:MAG: M14 family metallopeptidase [Bacteroidota bacterium]